MFRYRLNDTDGGYVGDLEHPAPNLEPGDLVTTEDGRRWRVVSSPGDHAAWGRGAPRIRDARYDVAVAGRGAAWLAR